MARKSNTAPKKAAKLQDNKTSAQRTHKNDDHHDEEVEQDPPQRSAPSRHHEERPIHMQDPRVPRIGTALKRVDRYGKVHAQATVERGGVRYRKHLYPSLSAAAAAAAKDLKLTESQNGFLFWGLISDGPRQSERADRGKIERPEKREGEKPVGDRLRGAWGRLAGVVRDARESTAKEKSSIVRFLEPRLSRRGAQELLHEVS